jgi:ABC-type dipeptide/oligopeptide/nickel transport system permease component
MLAGQHDIGDGGGLGFTNHKNVEQDESRAWHFNRPLFKQLFDFWFDLFQGFFGRPLGLPALILPFHVAEEPPNGQLWI